MKFKDQERVYQGVIRALRSISETVPQYKEGRIFAHPLGLRKEPLPTFFEKPSSFHSLPGSWKEKNHFFKEGIYSERLSQKTELPRIVGQVQGTYILCEEERGVVFIDQHAAHERILFERFKREVNHRSFSVNKFLIPITLEFSAEESLLLMTYLEKLQWMGFEIDPIGKEVFALRAIPSFFEENGAKELIRHILEELTLFKEGKAMKEVAETLLVAMACHSAIRGNFPLRREEMEELVTALYPFDLSMTCPHGRPIFFLFRGDELAKQFKRSFP